MIVVADTSPLNYLIRLGLIDLLPQLHGHIVIPDAVLLELTNQGAPKEVRAWASSPPPWLESVAVAHLDPALHPNLDAGEREAISLALARHADLILMDELLGRAEAELRSIGVTGTLGLLLEMALLASFDFENILTELRTLGFRFSRTLEADMIGRFKSHSSR